MAIVGYRVIPEGMGWSNTGAAIAEAKYGGIEYEGVTRTFQDFPPQTGRVTPKVRRSAGQITRILVRNVSGVNLLPKRLVRWKAGYVGQRVDGYVILPPEGTLGVGEVAGVVDEHWPAAGVPNGELFWLTIKGHSLVVVTTDAETANIAVGEFVGAATAGASTGGTGGQMRAMDLTAAGVTLARSIKYIIGKAVSVATTADTGADKLVDLDLPEI